MSNIVEVNVDNFTGAVIDQSFKVLVLLDISANWCGPCKVIEPLLDKIATEFKADIVLAKLEAEDENMKIAGKYHVRGFPTVIAIRDGKELERFHGTKSLSFIENFVQTNLKKTGRF